MNTDRVIKDGRVAVLYSPGYGSGWSTWNRNSIGHPRCIFDPVLVGWVRDGKPSNQKNLMETYIYDVYGADFYVSSNLESLEIAWVPQGAEFLIEEYDGSESVKLKDDVLWIKA